MIASPANGLLGRRILVVEDEWSTATELASAFEREGAEVVGPVPTIGGALDAIYGPGILDGAVVDINLRGEMAYPVADELERRGVPFMFATGYGEGTIPVRYRAIPRCEKPFDSATVIRFWGQEAGLRWTPNARPHLRKPDIANRLLGALDQASFEILAPHLEPITLPDRATLEGGLRPIEHCHFLDRGVVSVIFTDGRRESIEVGMIGREGMTGAAVLMDARRPFGRAVMQIGGYGYRIEAGKLTALLDKSATLGGVLRKSAHAFAEQMARTALTTGRYTVEQRLARWLLMLGDRADDAGLSITHETIALMLGVRRSGVTVALHHLAGLGCIRVDRAMIAIVDRPALIAASAGCYGSHEAASARGL